MAHRLGIGGDGYTSANSAEARAHAQYLFTATVDRLYPTLASELFPLPECIRIDCFPVSRTQANPTGFTWVWEDLADERLTGQMATEEEWGFTLLPASLRARVNDWAERIHMSDQWFLEVGAATIRHGMLGATWRVDTSESATLISQLKQRMLSGASNSHQLREVKLYFPSSLMPSQLSFIHSEHFDFWWDFGSDSEDEVRQRFLVATEDFIKRAKDRANERGLVLGPEVKQERAWEWLARHQVGGESWERIAKDEPGYVPRTAEGNGTWKTVMDRAKERAKDCGIKLRTPGRRRR